MATASALLVIDMQLVAFDGQITPAITNGDQLLKSVSNLIEVCRDNAIQLVFVQTCADSGHPFAKDMHGWDIHPQLATLPTDRIVYKRRSSAFDDTNMKEVLNRLGVDSLIVCGIWSEFCVASTSKDAVKLGFEVCIASDGHGTVASDEEAATSLIAEQNASLSKLGISTSTIQDLRRKFERERLTPSRHESSQ